MERILQYASGIAVAAIVASAVWRGAVGGVGKVMMDLPWVGGCLLSAAALWVFAAILTEVRKIRSEARQQTILLEKIQDRTAPDQKWQLPPSIR